MSKSYDLDYFGKPITPQDNNASEILGSDSFSTYYSSSLELSKKVSPSAPDGNPITMATLVTAPQDNNASEILGSDSFSTYYSSSLELKTPSEMLLDKVRSYPVTKYGPRPDQDIHKATGWFDSHNTWQSRFPLHRAAMRGEVDEIKRLCAIGKNPNQKMEDWYDSEPLNWAAHWGELKAVIALIECGADPLRPPNKRRSTPLRAAMREKHESTIAFFKWYKTEVKGDIRKKGMRMSERQKQDYIFDFKKYKNVGPRSDQELCCATLCFLPCLVLTPLLCCATWGCTDLVDRLTSHPCKACPCSICNPNIQNPLLCCSTPVHWAAAHGQLHTVMVLVKNGADPFQKHLANESACSDATRETHFHIVEWLDDWDALGRPTPAKMKR